MVDIYSIAHKKTQSGEEHSLCVCVCVCVRVFCLFKAAPVAYGGSQARGSIEAVATSLHHSHSNTRAELHLQPTPQIMATPDP